MSSVATNEGSSKEPVDRTTSGAVSDQDFITVSHSPLCTQSENDMSAQTELERNTPWFFSEPTLADLGLDEACYREGRLPCAASYPNLPFCNDSGISSLFGGKFAPSANLKLSKHDFVGRTSFEGSRQSVSNADISNVGKALKKSHSAREISEQHAQAQNKYRHESGRRYTDSVDFEGVLKILGGCTWWHIWVYMLISIQQVPHAMFSSSVVFLMYQSDHWCEVPGVNISLVEKKIHTWSSSNVMRTPIMYPLFEGAQMHNSLLHNRCHYFNLTLEMYERLHQMNASEALEFLLNESTNTAYCPTWEYEQEVVTNSIVREWSLVCNGKLKKAHAQLFYSLGFFFGCLLGAYVSDRFGRRPTLIAFGILSSLLGLFLPFCTCFPAFLLVRFLSAACNEAADLTAYVLCIEVTGIRYRAVVGSLLQVPWALGYLLVTVVAYISGSWQKAQIITASINLVTVLVVWVLPESPRWLIVNNRVEEAGCYIRQACRDPPFFFAWLNCNRPALPCDLELVKHSEKSKWVKQDQRASVFSVLKSRILCCRIAMLCGAWIATSLIHFVLLDQAGLGKVSLNGNIFASNAVVAASEIPTICGCIYLLRFGRKRSQIISLVGAVMLMLTAVISVHHNFHMVGIICLFFCKMFVQGSFNVLYIFSLELYPTVIRNSGIGINSMMAHLCSGVSSYVAVVTSFTASVLPLMVLCVFSVFAASLVIFLPETLDKPLPETLQDAVTLLQMDGRYNCLPFHFWRGNSVGHESERVQERVQDAGNDMVTEI